MGKIFDIDSPLMHALSKLADIMWLNILTLIFATPLIIEQAVTVGGYLIQIASGDITSLDGIVFYVVVAWLGGIVCSIPLGPALTAMHYVLLKLVRDEDSYVTKSFFKSFKENFKQGAILQVIQFTAGGILLLDFLIMRDGSGIYRYIVIAISLILYMVSLYIFPLLSKFVNTVLGTLRNAALMSIMALPKTVLMALVSAVPVVILYFFSAKALPILILMGIAGPGFVQALLYNNTFKRFEPKVEEMSDEEEMDAAIRKIDEGTEEISQGNTDSNQ
ncbi:hypothetical protein bpr_I2804 [Butyrivibrio proteoclasticus B316]|uniref:Membrane protein YesL n=1 Tax=Butyrivibrio proteoclasticus (strain ATCC 51982 / DSM 14932 / B316) TaxID=515622 RepID=E0RZW8_BUTPB|nr:DUF624 domain-containing protein [Butyrivibrio proteoclasticus]ADL35534.1 hypothetical protein bpr_I2804 [Butyrivibrio proteoclasticus B316]